MFRLANWVRGTLLVVWASFALPVATQFVTKWIERKGFYDRPDEAAPWLMGTVAWFTQLPGVVPAAWFLTGLVAGAWLDWVLRRLDGTRARERQSLGEDMRMIGAEVRRGHLNASRDWTDECTRLWPQINSIFVRAKKVGLWHPDHDFVNRQPEFVSMYLRSVGTLLASGQFSEAKTEARQAEDRYNKIQQRKPNAPRG
jgi:hypothetical protein